MFHVVVIWLKMVIRERPNISEPSMSTTSTGSTRSFKLTLVLLSASLKFIGDIRLRARKVELGRSELDITRGLLS